MRDEEPEPEGGILSWLGNQGPGAIISIIVLGEIRRTRHARWWKSAYGPQTPDLLGLCSHGVDAAVAATHRDATRRWESNPSTFQVLIDQYPSPACLAAV